MREYGILRDNLRRRSSGRVQPGYKRGTTRVGFWISRVLAQDFTSAAIRRDGQCVFNYGLEALLHKANFLMVVRRRQKCVGSFLAVWIFLLECVGWCRVSVVCDTIVGWALQGTHQLNGCFRGARVKISRRIFLEINVEKIDQRTKMNCKQLS